MPLNTGTRLGPYEITTQIGVGGMGEVYRATDTKLKRQVAIKVLPASVADDPDRLARFQREAEVLASLNHPNIAAIYGIEDSTDAKALVMELVEGPTLADRLAAGGPEGPPLRSSGRSAGSSDPAIPLDEALPIARQIAEALEAAHEQGIIHRDLKPANIKVRDDGTVKVLDFGLAKLSDVGRVLLSGPAGSKEHDPAYGQSQSPTITSPALPIDFRSGHPEHGRGVMTGAGMILGTAAYMSPEQARGSVVDKRVDLWAFGVVLYEMLTGTRLFDGATISDTLAAVLRADPDWQRLPADVPPTIRKLLRRCLEKDRRRRLDSASAVRLEIDDALTTPAAEMLPAGASATPSSSRGTRLAWLVAAAAVLAAAALAVPALRHVRETPLPTPDLARLEITLPSGGTPQMELSPDGRLLSFVAPAANNLNALWIRPINSLESRMLAGTEGETGTWFWSPDSRFIAFTQDNKLKRIEVSNGVTSVVADNVPQARGGSWGPDGVLIFGTPTGIQKVALTGGPVAPLTKTDPTKEIDHTFPRFLPDGRHFVYVRNTTNAGQVAIGFLDSVPDRQPTDAVTTTQAGGPTNRIYFVPAAGRVPAKLVFRRDDTVLAQTFDRDSLTLSGEPVPLSLGQVNFFTAASGVLAYNTIALDRGQLTIFDRGGKEVAKLGDPAPQYELNVSPDGALIAVARSAGQAVNAIWVFELGRPGAATKLTTDALNGATPVWSPNNSEMVFTSRRGEFELLQKPSNGTGNERSLLKARAYAQDWSRDGRFLLYTQLNLVGPSDLAFVSMEHGTLGKPVPYLNSAAQEIQGRFSPDSRWVVYTSDESGMRQVYVNSFPDPTRQKVRISTAGGNQPRWSRDGNELFYFAPDNTLMSVRFTTTGGVLKPENPAALFKANVMRTTGSNTWGTGWDVLPGGRFLVNVALEQGETLPVSVVLNWQSALK